MGLVCKDDGWRVPDWLWERIASLLPAAPPHPLGCHRPRVPDRSAAHKLAAATPGALPAASRLRRTPRALTNRDVHRITHPMTTDGFGQTQRFETPASRQITMRCVLRHTSVSCPAT